MCTECVKEQEALNAAQAEKARELVAKGIGLLNEKLPPEWPQHLDRGLLEISDSEDCVIGQLADWDAVKSLMEEAGTPDRGAGRYGRLLSYLGIYTQGSEYGFDSHPGARMPALDTAWQEALAELQPA